MNVLIQDKNKLEGTCYLEFLPRKYVNVCWNDESVFLSEEDFELIIPAFTNVKDFDYYDFIEIEKDVWQRILSDLKELEKKIEKDSLIEIEDFYKNFFYEPSPEFIASLISRRNRTRILINEFATWIENELSKTMFIWYLGM